MRRARLRNQTHFPLTHLPLAHSEDLAQSPTLAFLQLPAPSQAEVPWQVAWLLPLGTATQTPSKPATLQAQQSPSSQASLQQTPSEQCPVEQSPLPLQARPRSQAPQLPPQSTSVSPPFLMPSLQLTQAPATQRSPAEALHGGEQPPSTFALSSLSMSGKVCGWSRHPPAPVRRKPVTERQSAPTT
jgi:hypothetical protein